MRRPAPRRDAHASPGLHGLHHPAPDCSPPFGRRARRAGLADLRGPARLAHRRRLCRPGSDTTARCYARSVARCQVRIFWLRRPALSRSAQARTRAQCTGAPGGALARPRVGVGDGSDRPTRRGLRRRQCHRAPGTPRGLASRAELGVGVIETGQRDRRIPRRQGTLPRQPLSRIEPPILGSAYLQHLGGGSPRGRRLSGAQRNGDIRRAVVVSNPSVS